MTTSEKNPSDELEALEAKLDSLIVQYNMINSENKALKIKQEALEKENAKLLEKTALAKSRIEAMISRLKAMEHET